MTNPLSEPDYPKQFRCVGFIRGQYFASSERLNKGILVTDDGYKFPARLLGQLAKWITAHPEQIAQSHIWVCWPHTVRESPGLILTLKSTCQHQDETLQNAITAAIDSFSIRGLVAFQAEEEGKLGIRIERNQAPPEGKRDQKYWRPFVVAINGFLPTQSIGRFWELDCRREGEHLVLEDARPVKEIVRSNTEFKKVSVPKSADATAKKTAAGASTKLTEKTSQSTSKKQSMTVSGRLEVTIKINELPTASTVENNWKHFELDCDGLTVSVTVKPKLFKKLEDAKANYPQWVAAIAGKIGSVNEKGFVLLEPNIQTFERKPKEAKPAAQEATAEA